MRQHGGVARVCRLRLERLHLLGIFSDWKGHAAWISTDQRIHTLSGAVESYEQALREVGDEKSALEMEKGHLAASVSSLEQALRERDSARQELLREFESKFTTLQAEHVRSAEASHSWKSKLEDEQYHSHVALTAAQGRTEQLTLQFETALANRRQLAEEVATKNTVIATLQQRVQDVLAEISLAGEYPPNLTTETKSPSTSAPFRRK